jgi:hypothetical protein
MCVRALCMLSGPAVLACARRSTMRFPRTLPAREVAQLPPLGTPIAYIPRASFRAFLLYAFSTGSM